MGQFVNPANPRVHYETTGPEIYRDLNGKIDFLIAGSSSGAALTAAKKFALAGNRGNFVIILPDRGDRYFSKHLYG